jgi:uncharacterized protein YggE
MRKTVVVTLKDISKFEDVLSAVKHGSANSIEDVSFRSSEMRKYRDQARTMGIRAAREKAEMLTHEIGQKIGKAVTISEEDTGGWRSQNSFANVSQNISQSGNGGGESSADSTVSPGKIAIKAKISVSFELN